MANPLKRLSKDESYSLLRGNDKARKVEDNKSISVDCNPNEGMIESQSTMNLNGKGDEMIEKYKTTDIDKTKLSMRPPSKSEMDMFLKDCYSKPFCRCCGSQVCLNFASQMIALF